MIQTLNHTQMTLAASIFGYTYCYSIVEVANTIYHKGLSAYVAQLNATTIMFQNFVKISSGTMNGQYIFIKDSCSTELEGGFKITGDVYLVNEQDFNSIYSFWTNDSMVNYIKEHNLKPLHYENENYAMHIEELKLFYAEHYISAQPE